MSRFSIRNPYFIVVVCLIVAVIGLTSVVQLKGKKVGVPRGGAQELALFAELAKVGLTWSDQPGKDVLIVYLAYADLNQTLMQKQIDAMCQSEPQSAQAIAKGFGTEIVKPYDTPMGEPVRVMVMTEKMYRDKPDLALRVMKCFVEATQKFLADPALAQKYVREQLFKAVYEFLVGFGGSYDEYFLWRLTDEVGADYLEGRRSAPLPGME